MADYSKLLREAGSRITDLDQALNREFREIGQKLYSSKPSQAPARMTEAFRQIAGIDEKVSGYDSLIERIREIESRQGEIREELSTAAEQIRELQKDNSAYFESIGEAAYDYFRRNSEQGASYRPVFEPVLNVHAELKSISEEIETAEAELARKSFFDKVVVRGRLALLRTRQANKEGNLPRLLYRVGERIVETNFPEEVDSSDLNQALEPYNLNQRHIEDIRSRQKALEEEQVQLATELDETGATKRPAKRIREIESLRAESSAQRSELLREIGEIAVDTETLLSADDEAFAEVKRIHSRRSTEQERIERLEAAIEAEHLSQQISRIDDEISSKNKRMSELKKEVAALKKQKGKLDEQRSSAFERRGDESTIVPKSDSSSSTET